MTSAESGRENNLLSLTATSTQASKKVDFIFQIFFMLKLQFVLVWMAEWWSFVVEHRFTWCNVVMKYLSFFLIPWNAFSCTIHENGCLNICVGCLKCPLQYQKIAACLFVKHLRIFWIFVWAFWMLPFNPEEYLCEVLVLLNIWEYWLILVWFACSRKHLRLFSILVWFACFGKYLRFVYISVSCFFWKIELRKLKELCQLHVLEHILKYLTEFLFNIYLAVLEINWEYC